MKGYEQFCPVAKAAEIMTRRWMPLVVRELLCGSCRFNDIHRGLPKMSRSLLTRRLSELEDAKLIERRIVGEDEHPEYHLTEGGEELRPIIEQLGVWGQRWVRTEVSRDDVDAGLLMWDMQRRVRRDRLPRRRVVVHFQFPDAPEEHRDFWLVLERDGVDLCLKDPGYGWDLRVRSDVRSLTGVWLGDFDFARALKDEAIRMRGPRELRRQFPTWLGLSLFAQVERPA